MLSQIIFKALAGLWSLFGRPVEASEGEEAGSATPFTPTAGTFQLGQPYSHLLCSHLAFA